MKTIVIFIIGVIVLFFWGGIGFIFWIPLLARVIGVFCLNITYNVVVTNPKEYSERLKIPLDHAIVFYTEGFKRIFSTLSIKNPTEKNFIAYKNKITGNTIFKFIGELLWVIVFWVLMLFPFFDDKIYTKYLGSKRSNTTMIQLDSLKKGYNKKIDSLETLKQLAEKKFQDLQTENPPQKSKSPQLEKYFVQSKEGLYGIAKKFGVTIEQIKEWNNLTTNDLKIGQQLVIAR